MLLARELANRLKSISSRKPTCWRIWEREKQVQVDKDPLWFMRFRIRVAQTQVRCGRSCLDPRPGGQLREDILRIGLQGSVQEIPGDAFEVVFCFYVGETAHEFPVPN